MALHSEARTAGPQRLQTAPGPFERLAPEEREKGARRRLAAAADEAADVEMESGGEEEEWNADGGDVDLDGLSGSDSEDNDGMDAADYAASSAPAACLAVRPSNRRPSLGPDRNDDQRRSWRWFKGPCRELLWTPKTNTAEWQWILQVEQQLRRDGLCPARGVAGIPPFYRAYVAILAAKSRGPGNQRKRDAKKQEKGLELHEAWVRQTNAAYRQPAFKDLPADIRAEVEAITDATKCCLARKKRFNKSTGCSAVGFCSAKPFRASASGG